MTTRAQQFEAERRQNLHTSGKTTSPRRSEKSPPEARNLARRVDKKDGAVLEDAPPNGRPSRKSTRKSSHHGRQDNPKMQATKAKLTSPAARASRARASAAKSRPHTSK